jgi:hypothetical protein
MVGRSIIRLAFTIIAISSAMPLLAGDLSDFFSGIARDTKRRNCWPEPFIYADRTAVRQTLAIQESAGWERQNLLSEFHFLPGGNDLTEAGRLRVKWIMNEVPEPHRQIYVHRADSPQETAVRMQTVQRFVVQSPYAVNVPIIESTRTDEGWPADRIDSLSRKAATTTMDPKLMGAASTGIGSGGH